MHPILFRLPWLDFPIFSYGLMMALAFLLGLFWVKYDARKRNADVALALDLVFYIILGGVLGSRILYVAISERDAFLQNPLIFFQLWQGGLVFYGGFVGAVFAVLWFVWKRKISFRLYTDIVVPALVLGQSIGRIGCFLAGCCYGKEVGHEAWYAVIFPDHVNSFAPTGIPLYPTQLMESLGMLLLFCILMLVRRKQRFQGQMLASYMMLYAVLRSTIELFRGDVVRGFVIEPWLSTSQFISILVFAVGAGLYLKYWPRGQRL